MKNLLPLLLLVLFFQNCSKELDDYEKGIAIYNYYKNSGDLNNICDYNIAPRGENSCYIFFNKKLNIGYYLCEYKDNDSLPFSISKEMINEQLKTIRDIDSINFKRIFSYDIQFANKIIQEMKELNYFQMSSLVDSIKGVQFLFSNKLCLYYIKDKSSISERFMDYLMQFTETKWLDSNWVITNKKYGI